MRDFYFIIASGCQSLFESSVTSTLLTDNSTQLSYATPNASKYCPRKHERIIFKGCILFPNKRLFKLKGIVLSPLAINPAKLSCYSYRRLSTSRFCRDYYSLRSCYGTKAIFALVSTAARNTGRFVLKRFFTTLSCCYSSSSLVSLITSALFQVSKRYSLTEAASFQLLTLKKSY